MQQLQVCIYKGDAGSRVGSVVDDRVYDLNLCCVEQLSNENSIKDAYGLAATIAPSNLEEFINGGNAVLTAARRGLKWVLEHNSSTSPAGQPLHYHTKDVRLLAPILPSTKVICMGDTYESHAAGAGVEQPSEPGLFHKMSQVVVGPDEPVVIPKVYHPSPMTYDTELTVVIGKGGRSIPEEQTEDHIWGYTVFNDLTLPGVKDYGPRYKVFETSAPVGPWIVPKDQIVNRENLRLSFRINGEEVREGSTSKLVFSIPRMISEVSNWFALCPGDIITTGGAGAARPLETGDVIEATIESVGTLRNHVVLEE